MKHLIAIAMIALALQGAALSPACQPRDALTQRPEPTHANTHPRPGLVLG